MNLFRGTQATALGDQAAVPPKDSAGGDQAMRPQPSLTGHLSSTGESPPGGNYPRHRLPLRTSVLPASALRLHGAADMPRRVLMPGMTGPQKEADADTPTTGWGACGPSPRRAGPPP